MARANRNPAADGRIMHAPQTVTYHESCHLCHGQKITSQPRQLLRAIPNLKLVELPESSWCCGSAGIYNLIQPEMANELLDRKLKHIQSTGATIVATGNPGCLLQCSTGPSRKGCRCAWCTRSPCWRKPTEAPTPLDFVATLIETLIGTSEFSIKARRRLR